MSSDFVGREELMRDAVLATGQRYPFLDIESEVGKEAVNLAFATHDAHPMNSNIPFSPQEASFRQRNVDLTECQSHLFDFIVRNYAVTEEGVVQKVPLSDEVHEHTVKQVIEESFNFRADFMRTRQDDEAFQLKLTEYVGYLGDMMLKFKGFIITPASEV